MGLVNPAVALEEVSLNAELRQRRSDELLGHPDHQGRGPHEIDVISAGPRRALRRRQRLFSAQEEGM
jgi:hypothetical protein